MSEINSEPDRLNEAENGSNDTVTVTASTVGDYDDVAVTRLGPGALFSVFARCERVVARLKLLGYEHEFVPMNDAFKRIPRHYFARSSNIGEQFFMFTSLIAWLTKKARFSEQMPMPHEFDDPNTIINNVVKALKNLKLDVAFSSSKLKSGSGPYCVYVLEKLTETTLEILNFAHPNNARIEAIADNEPDTNEDNYEVANEENVDDNIEITAEQFEDDENDVIAAVDMYENEANLPEETLVNNTELGGENTGQLHKPTQPLKSILNTFTDPAVMTAEIRRIIPHLKITIRADVKDWKVHMEQIERYEREIDTHFRESVRPFLMQEAREIGEAVGRIASRESHLNTQFDQLLAELRHRQNEFAVISEKYRESSGTLNSLTETLNNVNEEIRQVKQQIEELGIRNTNGTPLLKIKQSLAKLENSIFTMRVQTAVADQTLLQSQLSDRLNLGAVTARDSF